MAASSWISSLAHTPSSTSPFFSSGGNVEVIGSKIYAIPFGLDGGGGEMPSQPEPETPSTLTVTQVITATESTSETSSSVTFQRASTKTVTQVVTASPSSSPSTMPTPTPSSWENPARMTDLSSFNVTHFAAGKHNLKIVDATANASTMSSATSATSDSSGYPSTSVSSPSPSSSSNSTSNSSLPPSLLQLYYPKNSINPAQQPQGGAEFYAHPIELSNAHNVSLTYSVFFPADFEWVLGGKLPGLYGGKEECSGGKDAGEMGCFSTRLMWRQQGAGELYLYAPKKQSRSLCADPHNVCDASYGYSIGRESFYFALGKWTEVKQTVVLNTPGKQDGVFWLDVNGKRVLMRGDIVYRNVSNGSENGTASTPSSGSSSEGSASNGGGGGLLGGLLGSILRRIIPLEIDGKQLTFGVGSEFQGRPAEPSSSSSGAGVTSGLGFEVGFSGLFFSTFFGGHEKEWASPKDQNVWFKGFKVAVNG
eukprot:GHVO01003456.1.p1 GENE.GHVO01003456.1~~GHVO01003456.1.p1  ORF type:complete len:532 (+),score=32.44 GHVO01003456.1:160-1596(+)